jgi:hypothetical protein
VTRMRRVSYPENVYVPDRRWGLLANEFIW